jgi:hypothetical protein
VDQKVNAKESSIEDPGDFDSERSLFVSCDEALSPFGSVTVHSPESKINGMIETKERSPLDRYSIRMIAMIHGKEPSIVSEGFHNKKKPTISFRGQYRHGFRIADRSIFTTPCLETIT